MNVFAELCAYDPRNPDNVDPDEERKENCSCDNCFYRRAEMAEEIIKLKRVLDFYQSRVKDGF